MNRNLPDRCGEKSGWNFDKVLSILHKVREIIMWGNSDNTCCQSVSTHTLTSSSFKTVAGSTNNKDVFMCILRFHARRAYLQQQQHHQNCCKSWRAMNNPQQRLRQSKSLTQAQTLTTDCSLFCDWNFNLACETGIQYASYQVMCCREKCYPECH